MSYTFRPFGFKSELLLELAEMLDTSDAEHAALGLPTYNQRFYKHKPCGTPACAWGLWNSRKPRGYLGPMLTFGITLDEEIDLFGTHGCANAKSSKEAASYIRAFVARKLEEQTRYEHRAKGYYQSNQGENGE